MISQVVLPEGGRLRNKGVGAPHNTVLVVCSFPHSHWCRVVGTVALQRVVRKAWIHKAQKVRIHKTAAGAPVRDMVAAAVDSPDDTLPALVVGQGTLVVLSLP